MIQLIAIDFDGTFLDDQKRVPERNRDAVLAVMQRGVKVVPCSGRFPDSMETGLRALRMWDNGSYFIACNGARIMCSGQEKPVRQVTAPTEGVRALLYYARKHPDMVNAQIYCDNHFYVERMTSFTYRYEVLAQSKATLVEDLETILEKPIDKIVFTGGEGVDLMQVEKSLEGRLPEGIQMFRSSSYLLEFVSEEAGKWGAIEALCRMWDIPLTDVMCLGDSENDSQMVRMAGIGAVPANAEKELKKAADYVSPYDNNHNAVAEILETYAAQMK